MNNNKGKTAIVFHTSAATNIATLCRVTCEARANGAFNIVDPHALPAMQIGQSIAPVYDADVNLIPLQGPPKDIVGQHPWCIPADMIMDMTCALNLGYQPVVSYTDTIDRVCRSAQAMVATGIVLPSYLGAEFFDYQTEDEGLDAHFKDN